MLQNLLRTSAVSIKHPVAAIQMVSGASIGPNLLTARHWIQKAVDQGAKLVVLPENFACMPLEAKDMICIAENFGNGRIQEWASRMAEEFGVWLVAGSLPIQSEQFVNKIRLSCIVWDDSGLIRARYDKAHVLDLGLLEKVEGQCAELEMIESGDEAVVVESPFGKIGLSIGDDLRFPELYRALRAKGADILLIPSAFSKITGQAHWKALLTARAIENQCVVIAPNQGGKHDNQEESFGHSMMIDAWGRIQNCLETADPGVVMGEIDPLQCQILREDFPIFQAPKNFK